MCFQPLAGLLEGQLKSESTSLELKPVWPSSSKTPFLSLHRAPRCRIEVLCSFASRISATIFLSFPSNLIVRQWKEGSRCGS